MSLGYRVRRPSWERKEHLRNFCGILEKRTTELSDDCIYCSDGDWLPYLEDVLANDWEIITEGIIKDFPIEYGD